jgi:hypothetical protein
MFHHSSTTCPSAMAVARAIGVDIGYRRLPLVQVSATIVAAAAGPTVTTTTTTKTLKRKRAAEPPTTRIKLEKAVLLDLVENRRIHEYHHAAPTRCYMDTQHYVPIGDHSNMLPEGCTTLAHATSKYIYRSLARLIAAYEGLYEDDRLVPVYIEQQGVSGADSINFSLSKSVLTAIEAGDARHDHYAAQPSARQILFASKKAGVEKDTPKQKKLRLQGDAQALLVPKDYDERKGKAVAQFFERLARDDPAGYAWLLDLQNRGKPLGHKIDDICDGALIALEKVDNELARLPR